MISVLESQKSGLGQLKSARRKEQGAVLCGGAGVTGRGQLLRLLRHVALLLPLRVTVAVLPCAALRLQLRLQFRLRLLPRLVRPARVSSSMW